MTTRTAGGHGITINFVVARGLGLPVDGLTLGRQIIDPLIAADRQALREGGDQGILKSEPNRSTVRQMELAGRNWVVKRYVVRPWRTRLLHRLGQTPVQREMRGAELLAGKGRRANPPLARGICRPLRGDSQLLIMPYLDEAVAADQLFADTAGASLPKPQITAAQRLNLARSIGRQVGLMLRVGIVNRDHKLSNLMVDPQCLAGEEPIIIDPVGLGRRRSRRQVLRMFSMMIRTTHRAGPFTTREGLTCLKAALEADPTLGQGMKRPPHDLARAILRLRHRGIG